MAIPVQSFLREAALGRARAGSRHAGKYSLRRASSGVTVPARCGRGAPAAHVARKGKATARVRGSLATTESRLRRLSCRVSFALVCAPSVADCDEARDPDAQRPDEIGR